jgi:hypothetical protein
VALFKKSSPYTKLNDGETDTRETDESSILDDVTAELELSDDSELSVDSEQATFKFANHTLVYNFAEKSIDYTFEKNISLPDDGIDSEWVSIGLEYPVLPSINVAGSLGIGGGVSLTVTGNVKIQYDALATPKAKGSINASRQMIRQEFMHLQS